MPDDIRHGLMFVASPDLWGSHFRPLRLLAEEELAGIKAAVNGTRQYYSVNNGVALIPIKGLLVKDPQWMGETSTIAATVAVKQAAADKAVKSIMLVVDSPGGEVVGIKELANAIYQARAVKPVVAQVDGLAASAAYWAASQASRIVAHELDAVGSIGVYGLVVDDSKMYEDMGVKVHLVTTGEFKGADEVGQPVTDAQLKDRQRVVDVFFNAFVGDIMRGRSMTREAVLALADGRLWIGAENVGNRLIDGISDFSATFANLAAAGQSSDGRLSARMAGASLALAEMEVDAHSRGLPLGKAQ